MPNKAVNLISQDFDLSKAELATYELEQLKTLKVAITDAASFVQEENDKVENSKKLLAYIDERLIELARQNLTKIFDTEAVDTIQTYNEQQLQTLQNEVIHNLALITDKKDPLFKKANDFLKSIKQLISELIYKKVVLSVLTQDELDISDFNDFFRIQNNDDEKTQKEKITRQKKLHHNLNKLSEAVNDLSDSKKAEQAYVALVSKYALSVPSPENKQTHIEILKQRANKNIPKVRKALASKVPVSGPFGKGLWQRINHYRKNHPAKFWLATIGIGLGVLAVVAGLAITGVGLAALAGTAAAAAAIAVTSGTGILTSIFSLGTSAIIIGGAATAAVGVAVTTVGVTALVQGSHQLAAQAEKAHRRQKLEQLEPVPVVNNPVSETQAEVTQASADIPSNTSNSDVITTDDETTVSRLLKSAKEKFDDIASKINNVGHLNDLEKLAKTDVEKFKESLEIAADSYNLAKRAGKDTNEYKNYLIEYEKLVVKLDELIQTQKNELTPKTPEDFYSYRLQALSNTKYADEITALDQFYKAHQEKLRSITDDSVAPEAKLTQLTPIYQQLLQTRQAIDVKVGLVTQQRQQLEVTKGKVKAQIEFLSLQIVNAKPMLSNILYLYSSAKEKANPAIDKQLIIDGDKAIIFLAKFIKDFADKPIYLSDISKSKFKEFYDAVEAIRKLINAVANINDVVKNNHNAVMTGEYMPIINSYFSKADKFANSEKSTQALLKDKQNFQRELSGLLESKKIQLEEIQNKSLNDRFYSDFMSEISVLLQKAEPLFSKELIEGISLQRLKERAEYDAELIAELDLSEFATYYSLEIPTALADQKQVTPDVLAALAIAMPDKKISIQLLAPLVELLHAINQSVSLSIANTLLINKSFESFINDSLSTDEFIKIFKQKTNITLSSVILETKKATLSPITQYVVQRPTIDEVPKTSTKNFFALLDQLDDKHKILYQHEQFTVEPTSTFDIGTKGVSQETTAAFGQFLDEIEKSSTKDLFEARDLLYRLRNTRWAQDVLKNNPTLYERMLALETQQTNQTANRLFVINRTDFLSVPDSELLNPADYKKPGLCPNLEKITEHFNQISNLVRIDIFKDIHLDNCTQRVAFWIAIAEQCFQQGNFAGMQAVLSGLNSAEIHRLLYNPADNSPSLVIRGLPVAIKNKFMKLTELVGTSASYKNLRVAMQSQSGPIIPFLGIYQSDLTFAQDGEPTKPLNETIAGAKTLAAISDMRQSLESQNNQTADANLLITQLDTLIVEPDFAKMQSNKSQQIATRDELNTKESSSVLLKFDKLNSSAQQQIADAEKLSHDLQLAKSMLSTLAQDYLLGVEEINPFIWMDYFLNALDPAGRDLTALTKLQDAKAKSFYKFPLLLVDIQQQLISTGIVTKQVTEEKQRLLLIQKFENAKVRALLLASHITITGDDFSAPEILAAIANVNQLGNISSSRDDKVAALRQDLLMIGIDGLTDENLNDLIKFSEQRVLIDKINNPALREFIGNNSQIVLSVAQIDSLNHLTAKALSRRGQLSVELKNILGHSIVLDEVVFQAIHAAAMPASTTVDSQLKQLLDNLPAIREQLAAIDKKQRFPSVLRRVFQKLISPNEQLITYAQFVEIFSTIEQHRIQLENNLVAMDEMDILLKNNFKYFVELLVAEVKDLEKHSESDLVGKLAAVRNTYESLNNIAEQAKNNLDLQNELQQLSQVDVQLNKLETKEKSQQDATLMIALATPSSTVVPTTASSQVATHAQPSITQINSDHTKIVLPVNANGLSYQVAADGHNSEYKRPVDYLNQLPKPQQSITKKRGYSDDEKKVIEHMVLNTVAELLKSGETQFSVYGQTAFCEKAARNILAISSTAKVFINDSTKPYQPSLKHRLVIEQKRKLYQKEGLDAENIKLKLEEGIIEAPSNRPKPGSAA